jgi:hypothetical protein
MDQKFKLEDKEYDVENLSRRGKETLNSLQFTTRRIQELFKTKGLLARARQSYIDDLKKEIISNKTGFIVEDE